MIDDDYNDIEIEIPLGYLLEHTWDWDVFCEDTGLNPWLLKEGIAESVDKYPVKISLLKKHGILRV